MNKRKYINWVVIMLIASSCADITQKDWHIDTIELADEYFPRYFEHVEERLLVHNISYKKEYKEEYFMKNKDKLYELKYFVTEKYFFNFSYWYDSNLGSINCSFVYRVETEEEMMNLPQKYIDVMIDVVNFCSYNFYGTGEKYNTQYLELKEEYQSKREEILQYNGENGYKEITVADKPFEDFIPFRGFILTLKETEYRLAICLTDYLTDINIWSE